MHLLLFLKPGYKLLTPEIVDNIISAQWPDPVTQPHLFESVKKFMVHGPCRALNPHAPCMNLEFLVITFNYIVLTYR